MMLNVKIILLLLILTQKKRGIKQIHNIHEYYDDLTNSKYIYDFVNKNKKTIKGFEQGRTSHTFR